MTANWPDDPETVAEANAHPETLAGKTVGQFTDHVAAVVLNPDPPTTTTAFAPIPEPAPIREPATAHRSPAAHGCPGHHAPLTAASP